MDAIISWTGLTQADVLAMLVGALICVGFTQMLKAHLLLSRAQKQMLAFAIGSFATYTLVPPFGTAPDWKSLWLGLLVGLFTPTAFRIFKIIAHKRGWEWAKEL